jgi:hypothetical protein
MWRVLIYLQVRWHIKVSYIDKALLAALRRLQPVCDHCDALDEVLIDLTGPKVAAVIMKRVRAKLHGESLEKEGRGRLAPEIVSLESTSTHLRSATM